MSQRHKTNGPTAVDFGYMAETGTKSLAAMAELHSRMFKDAVAFNAEIAEFTKRRLSVDLETGERLAKCRSLTDAADVMGTFYQRAVQDYADEANALMKLGERAIKDASGSPDLAE